MNEKESARVGCEAFALFTCPENFQKAFRWFRWRSSGIQKGQSDGNPMAVRRQREALLTTD